MWIQFYCHCCCFIFFSVSQRLYLPNITYRSKVNDAVFDNFTGKHFSTDKTFTVTQIGTFNSLCIELLAQANSSEPWMSALYWHFCDGFLVQEILTWMGSVPASLICISQFIAHGNTGRQFAAICQLFHICLPCNLQIFDKVMMSRGLNSM